MSQSPQAGQFNSYNQIILKHTWSLWQVSIPSSGSIQFLPKWVERRQKKLEKKSQSPQAGQFNSYKMKRMYFKERIEGLNPLKRVNSILTNEKDIL